MGREVKRVSLDFDWFEKTSEDNRNAKTWWGYIINLSMKCKLCDGEGKNLKGKDCPACFDGDIPITIEPPEGEGWQMWETISEGSPISPVFKTPEKLAEWLVINKASSFGLQTATKEQWLAMIKDGWCPSLILTTKGLMSGVQAYEPEKGAES